jgi:prepilin-type processing-associated H-X9-DG protein
MSFRLWTIFYAFALVAVALATFGAWGILPAGYVAIFWGFVFYAPNGDLTPAKLLFVAALLILAAVTLFQAVSTPRAVSQRGQCFLNVRSISRSILTHARNSRGLPSPIVNSGTNQPLLSWRARLLRHLNRPGDYDQIDFAQVWNSAANGKVTFFPIGEFQCPSHGTLFPSTNYFAVVGPQTAWPPDGGRTLGEITDGLADTILLIEAGDRGINWAEPRDLSFDEAVELLTSPTRQGVGHVVNHGFFYKPGHVLNVAFADGSVDWLHLPLDRELAVALLTVNGGEPEARGQAAAPKLDYAKCYVFGLFVFLAVLPAAWVRRSRRVAARENEYAEQKAES